MNAKDPVRMRVKAEKEIREIPGVVDVVNVMSAVLILVVSPEFWDGSDGMYESIIQREAWLPIRIVCEGSVWDIKLRGNRT